MPLNIFTLKNHPKRGDENRKYKRFKQLLSEHQQKGMLKQKELLDEALENWRGDLEQVDDICVIGVRV